MQLMGRLNRNASLLGPPAGTDQADLADVGADTQVSRYRRGDGRQFLFGYRFGRSRLGNRGRRRSGGGNGFGNGFGNRFGNRLLGNGFGDGLLDDGGRGFGGIASG